MKPLADLAIIIVNWNTPKLLHACLTSIARTHGDVAVQTIVVDNGSHDDSVAMVRREFPEVHLVENQENLGFSKANNQGIRLAEARYVLLLNSDTLVPEGSLSQMVAYLDQHPAVGALGPKMLNPDGTIQREGFYRKFPSLGQVLLFYTPLRRVSMRSPFLVRRLWEDFDEQRIMEIDQIPGAALLVRREVLAQVGLLEERFPIWFEDVDWSYRAWQRGQRLIYYPEATIIHYGGQSFNQWSERGKMLQLFSSMYLFFRLHKGRFAAEVLKIIILLASLASIGFNALRKYFHLPGFKPADYEARKWFVRQFWHVTTEQQLPHV